MPITPPDTMAKFRTCLHSPLCHGAVTKSKAKAMYQSGGFIFQTAGSGWKRHQRHHACSPLSQCPPDDLGRRATTHTEFIKYAGLLYAQLQGLTTRNDLRNQYGISWETLFPNQPCDWTGDGGPPDHSKEDDALVGSAGSPMEQPVASSSTVVVDSSTSAAPPSSNPTPASSSFPHPPEEVPLFTPLPSPTAAPMPPLPSSTTAPAAPSPTTVLPPPLPFPTTASLPLPSPTTAPLPPPLSPTTTLPPPHSAPPLSNDDGLMQVLHQHTFSTQTKSVFSLIKGGLIPDFDARKTAPVCQRVLVVENPEHPITEKSVPGSFISEAILDIETYDTIASRLPKSIRKTGKGSSSGKVKCLLPTWLLLAVDMMEDRDSWQVTLVAWNDFSTIMVEGDNSESWLFLWNEVDLILGGLNFEGDFLNPEFYYGLTPELVTKYHQFTEILEDRVMIWPSPRELLSVGQKLETHHLLGKCALALGHEHPAVTPIPEEKVEWYAEQITTKKFLAVLKRAYSGWSNHCITPYSPKHGIKSALKIQKKSWGTSDHPFATPLWFCQPYLPLLLHIGEFRTFVVNGVIYYTVATTPKKMNPHILERVPGKFPRPLSLFKYDPQNPENPGWLVCDGEDHSLLDPLVYDADKGYEQFVLDMMGKMVLAEEQQYGVVSGLRVFARWDVSVFRNADSGKYEYVVSEITRSWSTCLFYPDACPPGMADIMLSQLAKLLHHLAVTKHLKTSPALTPIH